MNEMKINLWYNEEMQLWRWTLIDDSCDKSISMESGSQKDLSIAMEDIYKTVKYLLDNK